MFTVYKRKIHVWEKRGGSFVYCWSTNASKTCKEAKAKALALYPNKQFKASFAKD
jgi:hypothetical protein